MIYVELSAETEKALESKIQDYLREFPIPGYGTIVGEVKFYNNKYTCVVSRSRSAD